MNNKSHFQVLVIGGGTGGITVAAGLRRQNPKASIAIIEPCDVHYYQPLYTLVGAGADKVEKTARPMSSVIPKGVKWIKGYVTQLKPDENSVSTNDQEIKYDYLVVAPGLQVDWNLIEGLEATLGQNNVCSVYGYKEASDTWKILKDFNGEKTIFTATWTPVKCGGAAQKVMYLFDAYLRRKKLREKTDSQFISSGTKIFTVEGFTETLEKDLNSIRNYFLIERSKTSGLA